jgi:hypothetical protein
MSCCGSLFVNLGGGGGGTVNTGVLQIAGGVALDSTLRFVEDQNGTDSVMQLSTTGVTFGTGTFTPNGVLTVKGGGANIVSFKSSTDVEVARIDNAGTFVSATILAGTGGYLSNTTGSRLNSTADGNWLMQNLAQTNFTALLLGGTTSSFPAIESSNTPATLAAKDATGTNLIPFSAEDFTSGNLSTGTLITARPMQFGDKGTITDAGLVALGLAAQIAVEHNGNVYYIPCSTSLIS